MHYMAKALEYFNRIIDGANENHALDPDFYRYIQYKRALIKVNLKQDEEAITLLQEVLDIPMEDDFIKVNSFYLLGTVYDMLNRNQEAIESFREYLKYRPDDQDIKNYIRILSEKNPE
jgi:tetratricopeptide (TPR) repeat protein